ncbi:MAG TPA: TonB-dependent receptor [Vicinamibacteria bacterium]|nr:TonB-dependent receptor [Vicinamibacteria bacterium]
MRRWIPLAVLVLVGALAQGARAQEAVHYASVGGRVTDPQGAAVGGAAVTARQVDTNIVAATVSDADGRFRFPFLRIGPYEIQVSQDGFKPAVRSMTLNAGAAFQMPIALQVEGIEETVTVTGDAPVLETARSQIAGTVSSAEAAALPMNGRNFLELGLLVPGVSPTNTGSSQLFAETSAVPGSGMSVGSQRNFSNSFIVDGVSANDDASGLSGIPLAVESVEQLQVVTSGGQAELGRALGGYVSVVTRSGANLLRGSAYEFFRDDALNAANPLLGRALPMRQNQYGLSLGGPVRRDRTFFFANVERRQLDQSGLTTIAAPAVAAVNARLDATGYPGSDVATGVYPNPMHGTLGLAKLDHQAGHHQLSLRYNVYRVTADNSRGAGGLSAPSASAGLDNVDHSVALSHTWAWSNGTVNEARVQYAHGDLEAPPTDPVGPAVTIAGVAAFGTASGSPTRRVNELVQVVDTISHQAGDHALRAGVDFLHNDTTITYPRAVRGSYSFSSMASFMGGVYNNAGFTQTFGDPVVAQANPNLGVFVQDEWHATSRLTVNAGLRYDLQFLETIETDRDNVSPRVGFAWTPWDSRRTVIRGSAGLFYDRVPLRAVANAILSAGNTTDLSRLHQVSVSLSPAQAGAPRFPAILAAPVPSVTLPSLTTMDPHIQNARSTQAGLEVERQLGESTTVSAGYVYLEGSDLVVSINQNVPSCAPSGTNNGCRPNAAYANNSQYSSAARSSYHGLHVSLMQRPVGWGYFRASYTLSRARNNVGEFFFSSPIDPLDLEKDWGRSDDDQRHRLVVHAAVHTPREPGTTWWTRLSHGFQLSGTLQAYSSLPLNITSGVTTVQGTAGRPVVDGQFIPRNAGEGPDFLSISLRLGRTFPLAGRSRLEALAEVFNLTNRENVVTMNGNFGPGAYPSSPSPTFGQVTAVGEPRSFQLGLRFSF